jgi:hypothetical protein
MDDDEKLLVGYRETSEFLTTSGFRISTSSPAINVGPPVEALWGRLPVFVPSRVIKWARARLKPADAVRSRRAAPGDTGAAALPERTAPATPQPHPRSVPRRRATVADATSASTEGERAP